MALLSGAVAPVKKGGDVFLDSSIDKLRRILNIRQRSARLGGWAQCVRAGTAVEVRK
jgi:hypothetical protein